MPARAGAVRADGPATGHVIDTARSVFPVDATEGRRDPGRQTSPPDRRRGHPRLPPNGASILTVRVEYSCGPRRCSMMKD